MNCCTESSSKIKSKRKRNKKQLHFGNKQEYMIEKLRKRTENSSQYFSGIYYNDRKQRYVRLYRSLDSKRIKKACNRKFRRNSKLDKIPNGNHYRRYTEYWWNLA